MTSWTFVCRSRWHLPYSLLHSTIFLIFTLNVWRPINTSHRTLLWSQVHALTSKKVTSIFILAKNSLLISNQRRVWLVLHSFTVRKYLTYHSASWLLDLFAWNKTLLHDALHRSARQCQHSINVFVRQAVLSAWPSSSNTF